MTSKLSVLPHMGKTKKKKKMLRNRLQKYMFLIINYFPKREACQKVKLLYKTNQTRKEQKSLHVQWHPHPL